MDTAHTDHEGDCDAVDAINRCMTAQHEAGRHDAPTATNIAERAACPVCTPLDTPHA